MADKPEESLIGEDELLQFMGERFAEKLATANAMADALAEELDRTSGQLGDEQRRVRNLLEQLKQADPPPIEGLNTSVILKQLRSLQEQRPLCPDHGDKQRGKQCLACIIEKLERDNANFSTRLHAINEAAFEAVCYPCTAVDAFKLLRQTVVKLEASQSRLLQERDALRERLATISIDAVRNWQKGE